MMLHNNNKILTVTEKLTITKHCNLNAAQLAPTSRSGWFLVKFLLRIRKAAISELPFKIILTPLLDSLQPRLSKRDSTIWRSDNVFSFFTDIFLFYLIYMCWLGFARHCIGVSFIGKGRGICGVHGAWGGIWRARGTCTIPWDVWRAESLRNPRNLQNPRLRRVQGTCWVQDFWVQEVCRIQLLTSPQNTCWNQTWQVQGTYAFQWTCWI